MSDHLIAGAMVGTALGYYLGYRKGNEQGLEQWSGHTTVDLRRWR